MNRADLLAWGDTLDARSTLPRWVRRLVRATGKGLTVCEFPSEEGTATPGYDGRTRANASTVEVPEGDAVWEMGVDRNPARKAQKDYEKRTADSLDVDPSQATYICVTPRSWPGKREWAKARRDDPNTPWRDVRAYDVDDLIAWLDEAPDVLSAFAAELGLVDPGVEPLGVWYDRIVTQSDGELDAMLLLAGRAEASINFLRWWNGTARHHALRALTVDDGAAFVAASLAAPPTRQTTLDTDEGEESESKPAEDDPDALWMARAVFASHAAGAGAFAARSRDHLFIAAAPEIAAAIMRVGERGHRIVVIHDATLPSPDGQEIGRIRIFAAGDILRERGAEYDIARAHARALFAGLPTYLRRFGRGPSIPPGWAQGTGAVDTLPFVLVGRWKDREGDWAFLDALGGWAPGTARDRANSLLRVVDSPLRREGDSLLVAHREDAVDLVRHEFTREFLNRTYSLVTDALASGEEWALMRDAERIVREWRGESQPGPSFAAQNGLADGLALTAVYVPGEGQRFADAVVKALLNGATPNRWRKLAGLLPTLAEASPNSFLEAVETDLRREESGVRLLFDLKAEESLFDSPNHTGLLFGLERTAWLRDFMSRSILVLGRLAEIDPGGRWGNRPAHSMHEILRHWWPQTEAPRKERMIALDLLRRQSPRVAWSLMLRLLPDHSESGSSTADPDYRPVGEPDRLSTYGDMVEFSDDLSARLREDAGDDPKRWGELIGRAPSLTQPAIAAVSERLVEIAAESDDKARHAMWTVLRGTVARHVHGRGYEWALPEHVTRELEDVLNKIAPGDVVLRTIWLFGGHPQLIWWGERNDYDAERQERERLKREAVREWLDMDWETLLRGIRAVANPGEIGFVLSHLVEGEEAYGVTARLLAEEDESTQLAAGQLNRYISWRNGEDWSLGWLSDGRMDGLSEWSRDKIYETIVAGPRMWDAIEALGEEEATRYWRAFRSMTQDSLNAGERERMLRSLMVCGNYACALGYLRDVSHQDELTIPSALILEVLRGAMTSNDWSRGDPSDGDDYGLGQVFMHVRRDPQVDDDQLVLAEWLWSWRLTRADYKMRLHERLSESPSELISLLQGEAGEGTAATLSRTVLDDWRVIPGSDDSTIHADRLLVHERGAQPCSFGTEGCSGASNGRSARLFDAGEGWALAA